MAASSQNFALNTRLLKLKVNKYALYGTGISFGSIIIATYLSAYFQTGNVNLQSIVEVQKTNVVLWFLDVMPLIFAVLGQYMGVVVSYEAGTMVAEQTQELRHQAEAFEKKAMHSATHDSLTGLPNRVLFRDRVLQGIRNAKREKHKLGILILDLDRFKEINDTMGHYNGDRLLKQIARRLESLMRESDTIARLGGDEFGVLLQLIRGEEDICTVTGKIHKAIRPPFTIEGLNLDVQMSVGAVMFPDHGNDVDILIQRADIAMYVAKKEGQEDVLYSHSMDKHSPYRLTLVGELRQAIENDELALEYQPKMDSRTEALVGVEALMRWRHKVYGEIPPDEFIPIAENTGLIKQLSTWAIRSALRQGTEWHKKGFRFNIAVNISARNLLDPDFPDVLTGLFAAQGFPSSLLMIEITETSIMSDPDYAMETINRLHKMGIQFSIDDFGTGYSSLSYLKRLPINEIKIDQSFVVDMLTNENDAVIVRATVELAHNLGLKVVAEGVENQETLDALRGLGCDILQGYYFSKSLSPDDFEVWWSEKTSERVS
jgi:diguanylate cyclase (GGDEF)-like protein